MNETGSLAHSASARASALMAPTSPASFRHLPSNGLARASVTPCLARKATPRRHNSAFRSKGESPVLPTGAGVSSAFERSRKSGIFRSAGSATGGALAGGAGGSEGTEYSERSEEGVGEGPSFCDGVCDVFAMAFAIRLSSHLASLCPHLADAPATPAVDLLPVIPDAFAFSRSARFWCQCPFSTVKNPARAPRTCRQRATGSRVIAASAWSSSGGGPARQ